jgi:hypothetical protein
MRAQAIHTFNARFRIETMVSALTALLETNGGASSTDANSLATLRQAAQQSR